MSLLNPKQGVLTGDEPVNTKRSYIQEPKQAPMTGATIGIHGYPPDTVQIVLG